MSLNKAILDYLRGIRISEDEIQKRRSECDSCDNKMKFMGGWCKVCKCRLEGELGKLSAPREKCPIGKWSAVKTEENG